MALPHDPTLTNALCTAARASDAAAMMTLIKKGACLDALDEVTPNHSLSYYTNPVWFFCVLGVLIGAILQSTSCKQEP